MNRRKILWVIIIGQAVLIVGLVIYRSRRPEDAPPPRESSSAPRAGDVTLGTLDDALAIARTGLAHMRETLIDYRGRMIKRERIDNVLVESEVEIKVQCRRYQDDQIIQPMRVYLNFLRPASVAGREVIWAEDQNDGKLLAHESGLMNLAYVALEPTAKLAMEGNRYPITEIGLFNLVVQLIKRGEEDLADTPVRVEFRSGILVGDCECEQIRITLDQPQDHLEFMSAEISIDTQRQIPLRYAAYGWPDQSADPPPLLEEYIYLDLETNVGLAAEAFDPGNAQYNFPAIQVPSFLATEAHQLDNP